MVSEVLKQSNEVARCDSTEDYETKGYLACVEGERAAIGRIGHCSCYGTWGYGDDDQNPEGLTECWSGSLEELKRLAANNLDPDMPSREINSSDYMGQYLLGLYAELREIYGIPLDNFATAIEKAAGGAENIKRVLIGHYGGYKGHDSERATPHLVGELWKWSQVRGVLDYPWDRGYGGAKCHPVVVWTDKHVITVHEYDGSTGLRRVPRNPENGEAFFNGWAPTGGDEYDLG